MAKVKNYYRILGVSQTAQASEIKQAFHNQARQYQNGEDPAVRELKEAYNVLTDPQRRKQYDHYMASGATTSRLRRLPETPPQQSEMQRWEYLTLEASRNYGTTKYFINGELSPDLKNGQFCDIINQLGGDGWELVGISNVESSSTYVFKRATDTPYVAQSNGASA